MGGSRQQATCAILQAVYPDGPMQFKAAMSNGKAGAVIGTGGQTLKSIRQQTGCSVQVERTAVDGERVVRTSNQVQHNNAQVLAAARMVIQVSEIRNNRTS